MKNDPITVLFLDLSENNNSEFHQTITELLKTNERYQLRITAKFEELQNWLSSEWSNKIFITLLWMSREDSDSFRDHIIRLKERFSVITVFDEYSKYYSYDYFNKGIMSLFCPFTSEQLENCIYSEYDRINKERILINLNSDINRSINSITDLNNLLKNSIVDNLKSYIDWKRITITLVGFPENNDNNEPLLLRHLFFYDYGDSVINRELHRPIKYDHLMKSIIDSCKPCILGDLKKLREDKNGLRNIGWENSPETHDVNSWIGLPLIHSNRVVGMITLDHYEPGHYEGTDDIFLERFARIAAAGIEQAYQSRNTRIETKVMQQISNELNSEALLQIILYAIYHELQCNSCTFFRTTLHETYNESGNGLNSIPALEKWVSVPEPIEYNSRMKFPKGYGIAGKVFEDGRSRIVPNAALDEDFVLSRSLTGQDSSLLVVPVKVGTRIIGVISVHKRKIDYFSPYDKSLIERLAQQAAPIIERTLTLQLAHDTSLNINRQQGAEQTLKRIVEDALRVTNADSGVIHRIVRTFDDEYRLVQSYGIPDNFPHPDPRLDDHAGTTRQLMNEGKYKTFSRKFGNQDSLNRELRAMGIQSVIGIPLLLDTEFIGVLYLNSTHKEEFNEVEIFSLQMFANQAASAIKKAELLHETDRWAHAEIALARATEEIAKQTDLKDTFVEIVKQVHELVDASFSYLVLAKNGENTQFQFEASWPERSLLKVKREVGYFSIESGTPLWNYKKGVTGLVAERKKSILIKDIELDFASDNKVIVKKCSPNDSEIKDHYIAYDKTTRSELAVPIKDIQDNVLGIINIEHAKPLAFTEDNQKVLELFASQAAIAIEKNRLIQETKDSKNQLHELYSAINAITAAPPETMLDIAVEQTRRATGAEAVIFLPLEKNKPIEVEKIVTNKDEYRTELIVRQDGISRRVFQSGRERLIPDVKDDISVNKKMQEAGVRAAVCLPLRSKQTNLGVMWLHFDKPKPGGFTTEESRTYQLYANQITIAYVNAQHSKNIEEQLKEDSRRMTEGIEKDYLTARRQSRNSSIISFIISLFAVSIIFASIFYVVHTNKNIAIIGTITGAITQVIGALFLKRSKAANDRMDDYHKELLQIRQLNILLTSSNQVDKEKQDGVKSEIIKLATDYWFMTKKTSSLK